MNFYKIVIFVITYLICSINPAIIICKQKTGQDIRKLGSGNAGTANTMRVLGRPLGIVVIILDFLKVYVSYQIILKIGTIFKCDTEITLKTVFILATVIGDCFPIFYSFKGGKAVVVGITVGLIINPTVAIACIVASFIIFLVTRIVSLSTICGVIVYIVMTLFTNTSIIVPTLVVSGIIMFKHRSSIQRLITRQEGKFRV